jgi:hypothetical protein
MERRSCQRWYKCLGKAGLLGDSSEQICHGAHNCVDVEIGMVSWIRQRSDRCASLTHLPPMAFERSRALLRVSPDEFVLPMKQVWKMRLQNSCGLLGE